MENLIEKECTIKELFDCIAKIENHDFKYDEFYQQKTSIKILNEKKEWVNIKQLIKKYKPTCNIFFDSGENLYSAEEHLIAYKNLKYKKTEEFNINDIIEDVNNKKHKIIKKEKHDKEDVYDFEIDSEKHLYLTSNNFINHNTGKSMLTDFWLGQNVKAGGVSIKVDIEDAIEAEFVAQIVGDTEVAKKIKLISPNTEKAIKKAKGNVKKLENKDLVITIEKLTTILNKLIDFQMSRKETKPICISIDSVSQLSSDKEVTDVKEENDKRDMTAQQNVRKLFRVINQKMRNANLSIFGIAHITTDINVKFGSNQVISAKGSGFKYANSLTLQMVSTKAIEDKKTEIPIGIRFKIRTTKNRVAFKGRECFLYLYFNGGVDKYGGLLELLAQYDIVQPCAKQTKEDEKKGKEPKKQSPKYGVYPPTTVFWYKADDKEPIKFTLRGIAKQVEDNGGGKLIQEWNTKLNKKYKDILKQQGLSPDDFLEEDDLEDEDNFLENLENSIE